MLRSAGVSKRHEWSKAAIMLRWRGGAPRSLVVSRLSPCSRSRAISASGKTRVQAAASSMASGIPSSSRQIWAMARASAAVGWKSGRRRRTQARKSAVAL